MIKKGLKVKVLSGKDKKLQKFFTSNYRPEE